MMMTMIMMTVQEQLSSDRVKPKDSSKLLLAADVKLRVDVIFAVPSGAADSRPDDESRRGELEDVISLAGRE